MNNWVKISNNEMKIGLKIASLKKGELQIKYAKDIVAKDKEIERLNNIINELKEWFKGYHQSYASCKWYEGDYIEFIEHLENELKGSDTNG